MYCSWQEVAEVQQAAQEEAAEGGSVVDEGQATVEDVKEETHMDDLLEAAEKAAGLWGCVKVRLGVPILKVV